MAFIWTSPEMKDLLRYFLMMVGALAVAYAANWLLDVFHLNPFGIRVIRW